MASRNAALPANSDPTSGLPRPGRALTLAVRAPEALPQPGNTASLVAAVTTRP